MGGWSDETMTDFSGGWKGTRSPYVALFSGLQTPKTMSSVRGRPHSEIEIQVSQLEESIECSQGLAGTVRIWREGRQLLFLDEW